MLKMKQPKIVFIGAGSLVFFKQLFTDMLSFPALQNAVYSLVDIDEKKLAYAERVAKRILKETGRPAAIEVTTDRKKAFIDADYVILAILHGGIDVIRKDIHIPLKYGVDQCIGDTLGPGGVFRFLRTMPVIMDICRDMEKICPNALMLNYTNPMAMICWAINKYTKIKNVGLCHSVQGTAKQLAGYINVPFEEVTYWVAGINHQAWFLEYKWNGKDAYPMIREKINDKNIYGEETTRFEMLKHLDYFVTESSGHNSEYNPWFRKRPDLLKKYTSNGWNGETGFIIKLYGDDRVNFEEQLEKLASGKEPIDYKRSLEYGSYIINSMQTDELFRINGNVNNDNHITNLLKDSCVEVPCLVDKSGIHPCFVGNLPAHLASINKTNIAVQELAVEAAIEGDKRKVFHSIALDPLTSAVLSLEEIQSMVNEMFEEEKEWLKQFKV
jgi:alpha-galactosidase